MNPTHQQSAIANANLQVGITKVDARAGAGKTSSLVLLSQNQETLGKRGLYVAFNKSSAMDAATRFPESVVCRTINAIAYAYVGKTYKHKLRNLRLTDAMQCLNLQDDWDMAKAIVNTINKWFVSAEPRLPKRIFSASMHPTRARFLIEKSELFWRMMCDPDNLQAPMTHDGYLKLYELSRPVIPRDYIMLDEGQDTNPVTWSILSNQPVPLIIVGDQYQSIYQFRGAFNAMESVQANQVLHLTQSFRFGPAVAKIANTLLHSFYEDQLDIEGLGPDTVVGKVPSSQSHAVICRTNAEVFSRAVMARKSGKSLSLVGGVKSYGFGNILQAWYLKMSQHHKVKDHFLKSFRSFAALHDYADQTEDPEVKRLIKIIETYGSDLEQLIPEITNACLPDIEQADVVLSTAHKCKGLTLRQVILADDFPELIDDRAQILPEDKLDRQEINLLYVAITRASHGLQLNETTTAFLKAVK